MNPENHQSIRPHFDKYEPYYSKLDHPPQKGPLTVTRSGNSVNDDLINNIIQQINLDKNFRLANFSKEHPFSDVTLTSYNPDCRFVRVSFLDRNNRTRNKIMGSQEFCLAANLVTRSPDNSTKLIPNQDVIAWYQNCLGLNLSKPHQSITKSPGPIPQESSFISPKRPDFDW